MLYVFYRSRAKNSSVLQEVRFDRPDDALEALVRPDLGVGVSNGGFPVVTMEVSIWSCPKMFQNRWLISWKIR